MRSKARHIVLWGGVLVLLVLGGAVLTLPVWAPAVVRPVLARWDVHYTRYERLGYNRFVLHGVTTETAAGKFTADRIEGLLPLAWSVQQLKLTAPTEDIRVDNWVFSENGNRADPSKGAPAKFNTSSRASPAALVRELQQKLGLLERWLPRGELGQGTINFKGAEPILAPSLVWSNGTFSAALAVPHYKQNATLKAQVPAHGHATVQMRVEPLDADLHLNLTATTNLLSIDGQIFWLTNTVKLTSQFVGPGWIPQTASLQASSIRVPARLADLPQYQDLTGSLAALWTNQQFHIDLALKAQPASSQPTGLPPVNVLLAAEGDTNLVHIASASVHCPWLTAELSPGVEFGWSDKRLRSSAELRVVADLAKQSWFQATGTIQGVVDCRPGPEVFPTANFTVNAADLRVENYGPGILQVNGQLTWPWLQVSKATLHLENGPSVAARIEANAKERFITNGILHVEGPLPERLLGSHIQCTQVVAQINFAGSLEHLAHSGALQISGLVITNMAPLELQADWAGHLNRLDHYHARLRAPAAELVLAGSANPRTGSPGLRFDELSLLENGRLVYGLEQPFSVSLDHDRRPSSEWLLDFQPFHWSGPGHKVALEASIAWPRRGMFAGSAESFDAAAFNGFLRKPLPALTVDSLRLAGHWTNGPVEYLVQLATHFQTHEKLPLALHLQGAGGAEGLKVQQFEITSSAHHVASGTGAVPLWIEPGNTGQVIRLDRTRPVALTVESIPDRPFWNEISSWSRIDFVDPRLKLNISGSLASPKGSLTLELAALGTDRYLTNRPVPHLDDIHAQVNFSRNSVELQRVSLQVEKQPILLQARAPLGKDTSSWKKLIQWQQVTGRVQVAKASIAPFARFLPKYLSPQGELEMDLALRPQLQTDGQIVVRGAATRPLPSLGVMDQLETRLRAQGRELQVQTFTGVLGGEPFGVTGKIDFEHRNPESGLPALKLRLQGHDLPLTRQPDLILRSDLNIAITATTNKPAVVSGTVRLRDSVFLSDLHVLMPKVSSPRQRPPYFSFDVEPFAGWKLDLKVSGDKFLKVRSPFFKGEVSTDLKVEGTAQAPVALGQVTINSGSVEFPFANLDITYGSVALTSADPYHPTLYVTAGARTLGYDVKMEVSGKADNPVIQFTSTPPLSSEQIVLMLTAGELPSQNMTTSAQQRASRLALFLGKSLLSEFAGDQGTADRLTLRSGEYISEQGNQTYSLEYRLTKRWSLVGEYDRFGDVNAGLKWRIYSK